MTGYTILSRRKKDGRWDWIGTCEESMVKDDVSETYTEVKLPRNFLLGSIVHARVWDTSGSEWFWVPNQRDAVVRRDK